MFLSHPAFFHFPLILLNVRKRLWITSSSRQEAVFSWLFFFVSISCWILLPSTSYWSRFFFPPRICVKITHYHLSPVIISLFYFLHSFPCLRSLSGALFHSFSCSLSLSLTIHTHTHISGDLLEAKQVLNILPCYLEKQRVLGSCLKSPYPE